MVIGLLEKIKNCSGTTLASTFPERATTMAGDRETWREKCGKMTVSEVDSFGELLALMSPATIGTRGC